MKGVLAFAFANILALAIVGCSTSEPIVSGTTGGTGTTGNPGTTTELLESSIPGMTGLTLTSAVSNGNVTIYPVTSKKSSQKDLDDMVTLDEAKRKGWVEIVERPDETVEELEVINNGPKAIFLMAGEVLLGGKQDRIVAKDTIVKPGETVKVPVFCVDQGRWSGGEKFAPSAKFAPSKVRKAASFEQDQGLVWDNVAAANKSVSEVDPTLRASRGDSLKKSFDSQALKDREADAEEVTAEILKIKDVVGVVVMVNGKVQGFEYFGSNTFFGKALPSVMRGVFNDSLIAAKGAKGNADAKAAAAFVADCLAGRQSRTSGQAGFSYFKTEAKASSGVIMGGATAADANGTAAGIYRGSFFNKDD